MTYQLTISTKNSSCAVYIGENLVDNFIFLENRSEYSNIFIITNDTLFNMYKGFIGNLYTMHPRISHVVIPDGEKYKNADTLMRIYRNMISSRLGRDSLVVAFGGGVVGDISGFAAGTFMRGIDIVHIPSTLLAMVTGSIGGKTSINLQEGKNIIGVFHHPKAVFCDLNFLDSLPEREFSAGVMEIIIYGLILDASFYNYIYSNKENIKKKKKDIITYLIYRSCQLKAKIIEQDENDKGIRSILNFGHTIGHALESYTSYQYYTHGEAVALGSIVMINYLIGKKILTYSFGKEFTSLLNSFGLPTLIPRHFKIKEIVDKFKYDKKKRQEKNRWITLQKIGKAVHDESVDLKDIENVLKKMQL